MRHIAILLVLLGGCRLQGAKWGGTKPRATNAVVIAIDGEEEATALATKVLTADPRVRIVSLPHHNNYVTACGFAREQGADYYIEPYFRTAFERKTECIKYTEPLSDTKGGHGVCVSERTISEGSSSIFRLKVLDTVTCQDVHPLEEEVSHFIPGTEEETREKVKAQVAEEAPGTFVGFPVQTQIGADGRVLGAARDGEYALFRNRTFKGQVALHDSGTPNEHLHMRQCCNSPQPGDKLLRRGHTIMADVLATLAYGYVEDNHAAIDAGGVGAHLRVYPESGGFQAGVSAEYFKDSQYLWFKSYTGDVGWDFRLNSLLHVMPAFAVGAVKVSPDVTHRNEAQPYAWTPLFEPQVRLLAELSWYSFGLDVVYAWSHTVSDYKGPNADMAPDARIRGAFGRLYFALTF